LVLCAEVRSSLLIPFSILNLPCLYDCDAFWPVHNHLKRYLVSTRDKYSRQVQLSRPGPSRPLRRGSSSKRRGTAKEAAACDHDQCSVPRSPSLPPQAESPIHRPSLQQSLLQKIKPAFVQQPRGRFSIEMGNPQADNREFLITLYDKFVQKGYPLPHVSGLSGILVYCHSLFASSIALLPPNMPAINGHTVTDPS